MAQVILQHLGLDAGEGGPHGLDLGQDVDAISTFLDHSGHPAHLALDPAQAVEQPWCVLAFHSTPLQYPWRIPRQGNCIMPLGGIADWPGDQPWPTIFTPDPMSRQVGSPSPLFRAAPRSARASSTPAPCTRRSARSDPETARSAA